MIINWIKRKITKDAYIEFEKVIRDGEPHYKIRYFKNFPKRDNCTKEYQKSGTCIYETYYIQNTEHVPVLSISLKEFYFHKEIEKNSNSVLTKTEYEILQKWIPVMLTKFEKETLQTRSHHGKFTKYFRPYTKLISDFEEWF